MLNNILTLIIIFQIFISKSALNQWSVWNRTRHLLDTFGQKRSIFSVFFGLYSECIRTKFGQPTFFYPNADKGYKL